MAFDDKRVRKKAYQEACKLFADNSLAVAFYWNTSSLADELAVVMKS